MVDSPSRLSSLDSPFRISNALVRTNAASLDVIEDFEEEDSVQRYKMNDRVVDYSQDKSGSFVLKDSMHQSIHEMVQLKM